MKILTAQQRLKNMAKEHIRVKRYNQRLEIKQKIKKLQKTKPHYNKMCKYESLKMLLSSRRH